MQWEELHDGIENSRPAVQETTFGEDEQKMGHYASEGAETPDFTPSRRRFRVQGGQWTRSAGRGVLTKPEPPAWSQGSTKPEYFMAPPSTKRLQN